MKIITASQLSTLTDEAVQSYRKRKNYNFHANYAESINRMLNAFEPGTYVQPHKHENPDKIEVFIILRGKALIVEFDDYGTIQEHTILDYTQGVYGVEISPRKWHTIISLEEGTVLYEVKEGPYLKLTDKNFASWAPKEGATDALHYNETILKKLKLK